MPSFSTGVNSYEEAHVPQYLDREAGNITTVPLIICGIKSSHLRIPFLAIA